MHLFLIHHSKSDHGMTDSPLNFEVATFAISFESLF